MKAEDASSGIKDVKRQDLLRIDATREVTAAEHELSFRDAARQYPQAIFWAAIFCISIIMSGYDAQIITSFYALPSFQQKYGSQLSDGSFEVSAPWQTGLGMGSPIGQVLGAIASSWPLERFGRRATMFACCIWSVAFVFVQFFATSTGMLCAGEILAGLAYGFYVVIAPTYASEICPVALRGILTASMNLSFVIGQFIAQGVADGMVNVLDSWAYKAPFAIQWLWPAIILVALPFAPESPYWLVRQGRIDEARDALMKLTSSKHRPDIDQILFGIEQTDQLERELESQSSYRDCFKGVNLFRTEITVMVYLIQVIGGVPLIAYAVYFFEQAGMQTSDSFSMGVGNCALGFVGTVISWPLMSYFGRRTIYNTGMIVLTIFLFIIGFLALPTDNNAAIWALATLLDVYTFFWQMTVGPICWVLISEVSSTRLKAKTIAIATAVQSAANIVYTVAMPYMLNTDEANWGGKTAFLFAGTNAVCYIWCFFRLPETRARSYEELDILFERKIPARQFKDHNLLEEGA
ncbi:general substrate transporter [Thozetella sp. PMI_491]|nr:general substrate transporter [Thozetella sp. PMI_491]